MAQYNGGQTQQNGMSGGRQISTNGRAQMPSQPGNGNGNGNGGRTITSYLITETGEAYTGLVLNWMGRLVTTLTGAYEGYFSKTLTVSTRPAPQMVPGEGTTTLPQGPQGLRVDPPIIIDDPEVPGEEEYQGGGGM
tara:strand:+ start:63 stop:470 length:408 start_codon:yes stop_codon:yes gene_type:complete